MLHLFFTPANHGCFNSLQKPALTKRDKKGTRTNHGNDSTFSTIAITMDVRLLCRVSAMMFVLLLSQLLLSVQAEQWDIRREIVQFAGTSGGPYLYLISELHAFKSNGNSRFSIR